MGVTASRNRAWLPPRDSVARSVAEFGISSLAESVDPDGPFSWRNGSAAMRDWVKSVKDRKDGVAVFTDTTMLYSCQRVVDMADMPSPAALFDLGTLVRSVVLYDHVMHFAGSSSEKWNEQLGERVFVPLDRGVARTSGELEVKPVGYALANIVSSVLKRMEALRENASPLGREELAQAARVWSTLLGRRIDHDDLIGDCLHRTVYSGLSPTADVFLDWTRISGGDSDWSTGECEDESGFLRAVVSEANHRSLINSQIAAMLEVPYSASAFRAPFRALEHKRMVVAEEKIRSVSVIQEAVRKRREEESSTLELPVFLSALLGRINSLDNFWEELASLRAEAGPFRRRRRELEEHLADIGSKRESRMRGQIAKAVARESQGLVARLRVPVAGAAAATVAAALSGPAAAVLTAVAMLSMWEKVDSETYEMLVGRFRRPYESFLSNIGEESAAMLSGLPRVARLWRIPERNLHSHVAFLERARAAGLR